jgi:hypothetical protein
VPCPRDQRVGSPTATCADIATATDGGNLGDHVEPVAGHQVAWDTSIGAFHGPGDDPDDPAPQISVDADTYVAEESAHVDITIDPRFATTISFRDLRSDRRRALVVLGIHRLDLRGSGDDLNPSPLTFRVGRTHAGRVDGGQAKEPSGSAERRT